jgi:hypothetical protein
MNSVNVSRLNCFVGSRVTTAASPVMINFDPAQLLFQYPQMKANINPVDLRAGDSRGASLNTFVFSLNPHWSKCCGSKVKCNRLKKFKINP